MPYANIGDMGSLVLADNASCENNCVILTLDDIVELMGNITVEDYSPTEAFAQLPEKMRPMQEVFVACCIPNDIGRIKVDTEGKMYFSTNHLEEDSSLVSTVLYTNGMVFNVCDTYYNEEIGNNYAQGTTPYGEV